METQSNEISVPTRTVLVGAAKRALEEEGLTPSRIPGRGMSNTWRIEEDGCHKRVSIRTSRNRWFAFPPLEEGKKWKTLDDVDIVVVATVDDRDAPRDIEVYRFDASEVRKRFDASYAARTQARHIVKDNFGMWVNLDAEDRDVPTSVGAGLAAEHEPIAIYSILELMGGNGAETVAVEAGKGVGNNDQNDASNVEPTTISEVLERARKHIATLSGVRMEAVRLDCRLET